MEQIAEWLGQEVLDSEGESLGKLQDIYYGREDADPQFALVKHGVLGRKQTIVSLHAATVGRDHIRLAYTSEQIEQASTAAEIEPGERISSAEAERLAGAFGLQATPVDLESANAIESRRAAGREAQERAAELAAQARELRERADQSRALAEEQAEEAEKAEEAAEQARIEAERLGTSELNDPTSPT